MPHNCDPAIGHAAGLKEALAVLEGEALVPWLGQAPVVEALMISPLNPLNVTQPGATQDRLQTDQCQLVKSPGAIEDQTCSKSLHDGMLLWLTSLI